MTSFEQLRELQLRCLGLLLRPIVRYSIRRSQSIQDFVEVAKSVYVDIAKEEMEQVTEKINISRISIVTGMHRAEVARIFNKVDGLRAEKTQNIPVQVLSRWEQDKKYKTKTGRLRAISFEGEDSEFHKMVKSVNKHASPSTVLFDLERSGVVKQSTKGLVLVKGFLLRSPDVEMVYRVASMDINTLIKTIDENLADPEKEVKNHHQRTEYNNIYEKDLETVRDWFWREGKRFHKRARDFLSQFDKDVVPPPSPKEDKEWKAGCSVTFCAFSNVDNPYLD